MKCFHCKRPIPKREPRTYVSYRAGKRHLHRWWCEKCATDEVIDKEYPKELGLRAQHKPNDAGVVP
jgi:hypothetical protein